MKIKEVLKTLEEIAPSSYQESYDNAGLIVGNPNSKVTGVLCCLDSTEAVIGEAIEKGCNLVVAHHPIIFKGLKSLTGKNYVERTIIKAIQSNVAIYAIHTNLDNVYAQGVNQRIGATLGLVNTRILAPKQNMKRLQVRIKSDEAQKLQDTLEAKKLNHLQLQWNMLGDWTSISLQFNYSSAEYRDILEALHEATGRQPATSSWSIQEKDPSIGSGLIGELPEPLSEKKFLGMVKKKMQAGGIRHTTLLGKKIKTVALCGGSGGFLLPNAIRAGAQAFITSDYKYHEFFDADNQILLADIGHFESEQYTIELLQEIISLKFSNFAAYCTQVVTNPVNYLQ